VLGQRIAEGVIIDETLWLRGAILGSSTESGGGLITLDLADKTRRVRFERGVLDMELQNRELWLLFELPEFESVGGIRLSTKLPGVVAVLTDINWAVSVSGATPLIIALDSPE
jgi:hypothetical protein